MTAKIRDLRLPILVVLNKSYTWIKSISTAYIVFSLYLVYLVITTTLVSLCSILTVFFFLYSQKPILKKVSKYENKFAKLQKKAAEFNFRNQLKMVKKPDFLLKDDEVRETLKKTLNFLKVCTYEFLVTLFLSRIFCLVIALSLAMTSDWKLQLYTIVFTIIAKTICTHMFTALGNKLQFWLE